MTRAGPDISPCADIVRRGDPDRFLSALLAKPDDREALFALYAFNLELARIPSVVSEPMLGMIRLQWWREAVAEIFDGKRPRAHEVCAPLAEAIHARDLPREPFERMLDARGFDVAGDPPESVEALRGYLRDTGGALLALAVAALAPGADRAAPVEKAGFGFAAAAYLRAAPALMASGRRPFPPGAEPVETARSLATDAQASLVEARAARGAVPKAAGPAMAAGWRSDAALRAALAAGFDPAEGPGGESPFRRRAGLFRVALTGGW